MVEQFGIGGPAGGRVFVRPRRRRRRDVLAEDFFPGAGGLAAGGGPHLLQFRQQAVLVPLEIIRQFGGDRSGEGRVGGGAMVARAAEHADFVFDLDGDDGVPRGIHLANVLHDGGEGPGVVGAITTRFP